MNPLGDITKRALSSWLALGLKPCLRRSDIAVHMHPGKSLTQTCPLQQNAISK